jgi:hypothetical protein
MAKTFAEQIADLKATRETTHQALTTLAQKSVDESRSMNTAEAEEFDTQESTIKRLDDDISRLSRLAALDRETVKALQPMNLDEPARPYTAPVQIKTAEKLQEGEMFGRYAQCMIMAKGDHAKAFKLAEQHYPNTEAVVRTLKAQAEGCNLEELMRIKATVAAGDTQNATWAAPLVYAETWGGDFLNFLRPRTLIGQAQFRPTPFNVRIAGQTSSATAYWVGEGAAKPVTKIDFSANTLPFSKIATIAVITQELARFSNPGAANLVRDALAEAVIERIDIDLFDPDKAAVSNVSPAGLLNGVSPVSAAGIDAGDPESIRCALMALWAPWDTTFLGTRPAYYTTPAVARALAFSRDPLGARAFPNMTPTGGNIDGVPVRVSQYLANDGGSGGAPLILVDESEIYLADDGTVTLDSSTEATIEMSSTPAGKSNPTVAASGTLAVSMWQTNSIAYKAERFIWWGKRRASAVQWIDGFPTSC